VKFAENERLLGHHISTNYGILIAILQRVIEARHSTTDFISTSSPTHSLTLLMSMEVHESMLGTIMSTESLRDEVSQWTQSV
jgi:hypothetical protein